MSGETYIVAMEGVAATATLDTMADDVKRAAMRAVNYAAGKAQTRGRRKIAAQVNLPYSYLAGMDSSGRPRLGITKSASLDNAEAIITGRHRPTSLARFVTSGSPDNTDRGVVLKVDDRTKKSKRMFLIRLPQGRTLTETKSNLGLAIRLRPGESVTNKKQMVRMSRGLYLLFGPSIDQIYRTVASDDTLEVSHDLEREFLRLVKAGI